MATQELTPTGYISHHLGNRTLTFGEGGFWTLHLDTVVTAVLLGVVGLGFLWWVVRGATAGVPGKRQAFVELLVGFVGEVRGYHGNRGVAHQPVGHHGNGVRPGGANRTELFGGHRIDVAASPASERFV